ncbi:unnamed protein product [Albugo candida]|uniref:NADH dehydrogenase [ubiquinone] 1 alpha subcomplex subunit 12 n=1 Tax=Albugo candida TaxID=65357 RepID=A0A024FWU9_9STRA|nr:unnamed protein product [Albugo candida]|eukprot:CCI11397.1 unnamed protein product [Albugo candida]
MGDEKFGYYVGTDRLGNKYYEDPTEVAGQQRYCEYHIDSFDNFDGDQIPPEWHSWLHYTTDVELGDEAFEIGKTCTCIMVFSSIILLPIKWAHLSGVYCSDRMLCDFEKIRRIQFWSFYPQGRRARSILFAPNPSLRCRNRSDQIFEHVDYIDSKWSSEITPSEFLIREGKSDFFSGSIITSICSFVP